MTPGSGQRGGSRCPDVVVVGGGIVGLAAARELAREGLSVEVVERGQPGRQASSAAAGMLAPLAEEPKPGAMFAACRDARDLWGEWVAELAEESGRAVEHDASGTLAVARDEAEAQALETLRRSAAELGEETREMTVAQARERIPDLAPDVQRVLHLPGDHRVHNGHVCEALVEALHRRDVPILDSTEVVRVEAGAGPPRLTLRDAAGTWEREAAALLVAAGPWSGRIPGLPALPVRPVRGQMISLEGVHWPWHGVVRAGGRYAVRRSAAEALLVGATEEEDAGFRVANTPRGLADLAGFVVSLLPGLADRPLRSVWAGLRPGTPDGRPLIGSLPGLEGVFVATGHHRNGILLAPWTARRIAARLVGGEPPAPDDPFSPVRFGPDVPI